MLAWLDLEWLDDNPRSELVQVFVVARDEYIASFQGDNITF